MTACSKVEMMSISSLSPAVIVEGKVKIYKENVQGRVVPDATRAHDATRVTTTESDLVNGAMSEKRGRSEDETNTDGSGRKRHRMDDDILTEQQMAVVVDNNTKAEEGDVLSSVSICKVPKSLHFYNPAQVFNRDLSLLVIKVYGQRLIRQIFERFEKAPTKHHIAEEIKGLRICEPLAASGLRSFRYAKELPSSIFRNALASDLDPNAIEGALANRDLNGLNETQVLVQQAEANELLRAGKYVAPNRHDWEVIDIDPYGSATPFIDGAVRAVRDGGLVSITSTDMPILGGNISEVAFYKYGGNTVKARYLHEMSLRLVIHQVRLTAAKYKRLAIPLLSLSVDFYVRIFFQILDKPSRCSELASTTGLVMQCVNCDNFCVVPLGVATSKNQCTTNKRRRKEHKQSSYHPQNTTQQTEDPISTNNHETNTTTPPIPPVWAFPAKSSLNEKMSFSRSRVPHNTLGHKCSECNSEVTLGGPFYSGPLHDLSFIDSLLEEIAKIESFSTKKEEDHSINTKKPNHSNPLDDNNDDNDDTNSSSDGSVSPGTFSRTTPATAAIEQGSLVATENLDSLGQGTVPDSLKWVELAKERFLSQMNNFKFTHLSKDSVYKIGGTLCSIKEELPDIPLYYKLSSLCNEAHIPMIKMDTFKSALLNLGYRVGPFHREPQSIKTDAPSVVVFDIVREWKNKTRQPTKQPSIREDDNNSAVAPAEKTEPTPDVPQPTPANDENKPPSVSQHVGGRRPNPKYSKPIHPDLVGKIDFSYNFLATRPKNSHWKARWAPNPEPFWGPGRKAGRKPPKTSRQPTTGPDE